MTRGAGVQRPAGEAPAEPEPRDAGGGTAALRAAARSTTATRGSLTSRQLQIVDIGERSPLLRRRGCRDELNATQ